MFPIELQIVLNVGFGGFSFDSEMALWLMENRGWTIIDEKSYNYKEKYPINTLIDLKFSDIFCAPHDDSIELRTNKDLIDCVIAVKKNHENDSFHDSYYGHINNLQVVTVNVHLEVENYYDGKEKINCRIIEE